MSSFKKLEGILEIKGTTATVPIGERGSEK